MKFAVTRASEPLFMLSVRKKKHDIFECTTVKELINYMKQVEEDLVLTTHEQCDCGCDYRIIIYDDYME